jgi:hypothetical protein
MATPTQVNETLTNKQVKVYEAIPANSIISINPGASATVTVEYNVQSVPTSRASIATWTVWPKGTLSTVGTVRDMTNDLINLRVTTSGGTCSVIINDNATLFDEEIYLRDWQTVENRVFYQNIGGFTPAVLTNPTVQCTNSVDNYTQVAIQNKSAGVNASSDQICYPNNVTLSDLTGFVDMGITSSGFSQAAYAVTIANDSYLFGSAPSGAGAAGNLVFATDATGSRNDILFATNGFNSTANFRMKIKKEGQVNFVPLAADPANPVKGDVYCNSVANKLKFYNGSAWETITSA